MQKLEAVLDNVADELKIDSSELTKILTWSSITLIHSTLI